MNLINDFKNLVSHLNAEDNDMANEFLEKLQQEYEWNDWTPTEVAEPPFDGLVDFILRDGFYGDSNSRELLWCILPNDPDCEIVKWRKAQ